MKLVRFATFIAVAGIAQVLATPLLVIPPGNVITSNPPKMKGHCASRFNQKAAEIYNHFRQALGLPVIQASVPPSPNDNKLRILPFIGSPPPPSFAPVASFAPVRGPEMEGIVIKVYNMSHPHPHHPHPHGRHPHRYRHRHHHLGEGSFINRIHYSLMNLGRWEGRAVAFVLGCGIGVLLRMIFVLGLVMYRTLRGRRGDEHEYSQITIIEEIVDNSRSAPPTYTYPVDEKVAIEAEAVKAPNTVEESK